MPPVAKTKMQTAEIENTRVDFNMLNYQGKISMHARQVMKLNGYMIFPHCLESVRIRSYSGPYFPAFRLNTERYSVSLRIQSKYGKIRTRITPNTDAFYAVVSSNFKENLSAGRQHYAYQIFGKLSDVFFSVAIFA